MAARRFDDTVLSHLDAAFNYARWLTRNDADAEDVVQDACVRAVRFFASLREDDARAWLLAIVRNTWSSRVARRAPELQPIQVSELAHEPSDSALDSDAPIGTVMPRLARARERLSAVLQRPPLGMESAQ